MNIIALQFLQRFRRPRAVWGGQWGRDESPTVAGTRREAMPTCAVLNYILHSYPERVVGTILAFVFPPDMDTSRTPAPHPAPLCPHQGKRMALPHSRVMIHQPMGGAQGQAEDIKVRQERLVAIGARREDDDDPSDMFFCATMLL